MPLPHNSALPTPLECPRGATSFPTLQPQGKVKTFLTEEWAGHYLLPKFKHRVAENGRYTLYNYNFMGIHWQCQQLWTDNHHWYNCIRSDLGCTTLHRLQCLKIRCPNYIDSGIGGACKFYDVLLWFFRWRTKIKLWGSKEAKRD